MHSRARAKTGGPGFHALAIHGICKGIDCGLAVKSITELNKSPTLLCQAVRAGLVAGREHALHAALLAFNSFLNKENRSQKKELEFLLWISGKRQLEKALSAFGLEDGRKGQEVYVVAASIKGTAEAKAALAKISKELGLKEIKKEKPRSAAQTAALMEFYGISQKMIGCLPELKKEGAIEMLVLEKISLLALEG